MRSRVRGLSGRSGRPIGRLRRSIEVLGVLVASAVVGGCLPAAATTGGREVERLYGVFLVAAAIVWLVVVGLATFAIVRYRRRGEDDDLPHQVRGNNRLEIAWTAIPVALVLVLFVLTLGVLGTVNSTTANSAVEIRVTAFRWGWTFEYPADGVTVSGVREPGPEVAVPVGEPIRITLVGVDVNHAFFVPQFLFKRDVIPGRENVFEFTVEDPGSYRGQCAEFCGIYHSAMPFTIRAVARPEYEAWLGTHRTPSAVP